MKTHLRLLGAVQITHQDKTLTSFRSHRAVALLAYLVCQEQAVPRNELVELIWPDKPKERGQANLRWSLNYLGKLLPGCWQVSRQTVKFRPGPDVFVDILALKTALANQDMEALATAVSEVKDELLWGFYFNESSEFESWLLLQREEWRAHLLTALEQLVAHEEWQGAYGRAQDYAQRLLDLDPWREEGYRHLMTLLARQERFEAALVQYEQCRRLLAEEFRTTPTAPTERLRQRILALHHDPPPPLPAQPTPLVGRQQELATLSRLLAKPEIRLATILGLGGIGKTRLALELATRQRHRFLDGVYYVPLSEIAGDAQMVTAVAHALHLPVAGTADLSATILNHLQQREVLLLLDNFDHLLADAANLTFLTQLLSQTTGVKLLITSRQRLGLRWEQLFDLGGLSLPADEGETAVTQSEAGQLFLQTARRLRHDFAPDAAEQQAIARLCRLVEGLPLALELAGAAVRDQPCTELLATLEQMPTMLAAPLHDLPPRQRSLAALFAHSWSLLTVAEQKILAALSIFRGGFTAAAAWEIVGATAGHLSALVDKALLRSSDHRYEMHELVRQFAAQKLAAEPEQETAVRQSHTTYYLNLLAAHEADFLDERVAEAITAVQADIANVRNAWQGAIDQADLNLLVRAATGLTRYYHLAGPLHEGVHVLAQAAAAWQNRPLDSREQTGLGELMAHHARLLILQGAYETAVTTAQSLLQLAQTAADQGLEAEAYTRWGEALCRQGRPQDALPLLQQALALALASDRQTTLFTIYLNLGVAAGDSGDVPQAQVNFEQALKISQALGDLRGQTAILHNLAWASFYQNDYAGARSHFEQELRLCRQTGDRRIETAALLSLGMLHLHTGDFKQATHHYEAAYDVAQAMNQQREQGSALNGLGLTALYQNRLEQAHTFFRRSYRLNEVIGFRQGVVLGHLHQGMLWRHQGKLDRARTKLEEAIGLARQLGDRRTEASGLCQLSLACFQMDDWPAAAVFGQEANDLTQQLGNHTLHGKALTALAHAQAALGNLTEAAEAYEQALKLHRQVKQPHLAHEAVAGLAHIALETGDVAQAEGYVADVLAHLAEHTAAGMEMPEHVHRICQAAKSASGQKI